MFDINRQTNEGNQRHRAEFVRRARKLSYLHRRDSNWKMVCAVLAGLAVLGVSIAMSYLTSGVLIRLGCEEWKAMLISTLAHLCIGYGLHFLILGSIQRSPMQKWEKVLGAIGFVLGVIFLLMIMCFRAGQFAESSYSTIAAWGMSIGLFCIEVMIPGLFGCGFAALWLMRNTSVAETMFYRSHEQLIEESETNPQISWNDGEHELAEFITEHKEAMKGATPEQHRVHEAEVERLNRRWRTLRKWNPTRGYNHKDGQEDDSSASEGVPASIPSNVKAGHAKDASVTPRLVRSFEDDPDNINYGG